MYFLFAIEDHTDVGSVPRVRELVDVIVDVLHNPHKERPKGEIILGQVAKGFVFDSLPLQMEGVGARRSSLNYQILGAGIEGCHSELGEALYQVIHRISGDERDPCAGAGE